MQSFIAWWLCRDEFLKTCEEGNLIEKDKKGCDAWKNMSMKVSQMVVPTVHRL